MLQLTVLRGSLVNAVCFVYEQIIDPDGQVNKIITLGLNH
jgi:hypothetical protein